MMWKLAFRNLFRNKRRTIATGAAVVAGFVGLTLLGGYIYRVEKSMRVNSIYLLHKGHITVFKKDGLQRYATKPSRYEMKPADVENLKKSLEPLQDKVSWIGYTMTGAGLISNGPKSVPFFANGVDLTTLEKIFKDPEVLKWGRDFLTYDSLEYVKANQENPLAISITKRLGDLLRKKMPFSDLSPEDKSVQLAGMNIFGDLNAVDATLATAHTTGSEMLEDSGLLAPLKLLQELYSTDGVHYTMVFLKHDSDIGLILDKLNQTFQQQNIQLEAYPFYNPQISPNYVGTTGFLYVMAGFFVFLICGAVSLSIMNSLTMGILERTREIGTFRAIGYRPKQISWMMTQEAIWLCVLSGGIGIVLATIISTIVNALDIRFMPPGVASSIQFILVPNPGLMLGTFLLFLTLVTLTAYLVTHFKLKMKVVELLSDSGA